METSEAVAVYNCAKTLVQELSPGSYIGVQIGRRTAVEEYFFQRAYSELYKDEQAELGKLLTDMVEILGALQNGKYPLKVVRMQELDPSPEPGYTFFMHLHDNFNGRSFQFVPTVEYVRNQIHGNNFEVYVGRHGAVYFGDVKDLNPNRVVHNWRGMLLSLPAQDREMAVTPRIVLFDPPAHLEADGIWIGVHDRAHAEKTIGVFRAIMKSLAAWRTSPVIWRIEEILKTGYDRSTNHGDGASKREELLADLQKLLGSQHG